MLMPGRNYSAESGYRYGFNGKENDNEVNGEGAQLDYGFRIYDTRLGRFASLDPFQQKYPGESPYIYTANCPILYLDPDGRDRIISYYYIDKKGNTTLIGKTIFVDVFGKEMGSGNIFTANYYKTDIYENVYINASGNVSKDPPKEIYREKISFSEFTGLSNLWGAWKSSHYQSNSKGSFQDAGFILTGGSGTTLDLKDKAGYVYAHLEIGLLLLSNAEAVSTDISGLFEIMDGNALQQVISVLEKAQNVQDLTQQQENIYQAAKEAFLNKKQDEVNSNPTNSKNNIKQLGEKAIENKTSKSAVFDPEMLMYMLPPIKEGESRYTGKKSEADSAWAQYKKDNPNSKRKRPPAIKHGDIK